MLNPSTPLVENKLPQSTNFNLSCGRATTMAVGAVTPIYVKPVLPADKWRIKPALRVRTMPLKTNLMGSFTFRIAWFFESDACLIGALNNDDSVSAEFLQSLNLPYFTPVSFETNSVISSREFPTDRFACQVGAGSLLNYLYFPVGADASRIVPSGDEVSVRFDLMRWLGFWDIYRNYYVNRQVTSFPYFRNQNSEYSGSVPSTFDYGAYSSIDVSALDEMMRVVRGYDVLSNPDALSLTVLLNDVYANLFARFVCDNFGQSVRPSSGSFTFLDHFSQQSPLSGLPLCCLRADVFTRMMNGQTNNSSKQAFATVNGTKVTVNSIISASRLQAFINNIDITGGRISDMFRFRWGVDVKGQQTRPICLGVDSVTLDVNDLRTTASTEGQSAGSQVGYVDVGKYLHKISFNNKSGFGGNLFAICTIIPNVYYSQGIEQDILETSFLDRYNPEFANENFVDIPYCCLLSKPLVTRTYKASSGQLLTTSYSTMVDLYDDSLGRTTAWWNYQTDVNRSFSLLSKGQNLESWLLNRSVVDSTSIKSETGITLVEEYFQNSPYVFPHMYNYCFSDVIPSAQNFIVQFAADINVRRMMPSYSQPKIF